MFNVTPIQIIIVLAIALMVFGPKRLPELGRSLGRGLRDFRSGLGGEGTPETASTVGEADESDEVADYTEDYPELSLEEIVADSSDEPEPASVAMASAAAEPPSSRGEPPRAA